MVFRTNLQRKYVLASDNLPLGQQQSIRVQQTRIKWRDYGKITDWEVFGTSYVRAIMSVIFYTCT